MSSKRSKVERDSGVALDNSRANVTLDTVEESEEVPAREAQGPPGADRVEQQGTGGNQGTAQHQGQTDGDNNPPPQLPDTDSESTDSESTDSDSSEDPAIAIMSGKQLHVVLPRFSGVEIGQTYQAPEGRVTEVYGVKEFLKRCEQLGKAADWKLPNLLDNVVLQLPPGTPAADWWTMMEEKIKTWEDFKAELIARFHKVMTPSERVALLNLFKQGRGEPTVAYLTRLTNRFGKYTEGIEEAWKAPEFAGYEQQRLTDMVRGAEIAMNFFLVDLFRAGMRPDIRHEVVKFNCEDTSAMLKIAASCEQAADAVKGSPPDKQNVAAVDTAPNQQSRGKEKKEKEKDGDFDARVDAKVAAAIAKYIGNDKKGEDERKQKEKKQKDRPRETKCYYCQRKGHFANDCEDRRAHRASGIWRPVISDEPLTMDQYLQLSSEERSKGKNLVATVSYSDAARRRRHDSEDDEDAYAGYYSSGI